MTYLFGRILVLGLLIASPTLLQAGVTGTNDPAGSVTLPSTLSAPANVTAGVPFTMTGTVTNNTTETVMTTQYQIDYNTQDASFVFNPSTHSRAHSPRSRDLLRVSRALIP